MERKRKFEDGAEEAGPITGLTQDILRNADTKTATTICEAQNIAAPRNKEYPTRPRAANRTEQIVNSDTLDDIYPTRLPSLRQTSKQNQLCTRCIELDLDDLFARTISPASRRGIELRTLSPAREWEAQSCVLCSLLYSLRHFTGHSDHEVQLEALHTKEMKDKIWSSIETILLRGQENYMKYQRYLILQPEGTYGPVNIIKKYISHASFENVKDWLSLCREKHTKVCSVKNQVSISRFKLIDCNTRTIQPGGNHKYVALSYVWGAQARLDIPEEDPKKLPSLLPNTILDAVEVTKRLGFRYLWIDRYCINQRNAHEVAETCSKMDLIYHYAELTIIAAAGNGPEYGLPGWRNCRRKTKHLTACAKIDKHFLISGPLEPALPSFGEWSTRGWTYQEALLSRRRLVFTEEQMYFECYGMFCCESVNFPLEEMHQEDMQGFRGEFCSENRVGIFPRGVGATPIEIVRRIEEFSELSLSNPSDILKAMQGILSNFHRELGVQNCLGIPILPSNVEGQDTEMEGWTPTVGFVLGLMWNNTERCKRRDGFPSWSWTGWQSFVKWGDDSYGELRDWPSFKVDPDIRLSCELEVVHEHDQKSLSIQTFHENNMEWDDMSMLITNFITIEAWTIRIWIRRRIFFETIDNCHVEIELQDGGHLIWKLFSFSEEMYGPEDLLKGIILGNSMIAAPDRGGGIAILIVMEVRGVMERIALAPLVDEYFERYDKEGTKVERTSEQFAINRRDLIRTREEVRLG